jgi:hypothetical protein
VTHSNTFNNPRTLFRIFAQLLALTGILASLHPAALAGTVAVTDNNPIDRVFTSDGAAVIKTIPIGSAAGSPDALISSAYPGWTVTSGGSSPGTFSVSKYRAGSTGGSGGTEIEVSYDNGAAIAAGQQFQWVQVITTNEPLGGATSPYLDPQPNDDSLPFYWTSTELPSYSTSTSLNFYDYSQRATSSLANNDPISWKAGLYLVSWDGATSVSVMDGVSWGWEMTSATKGSATGVFNSPAPGSAVTTGVGTSHFTWGAGSPGSLDFAGASFNPKPGDAFKLGTLSYSNGATDQGTEATSVALALKVLLDHAPEKPVNLASGLSIVNTPNTGSSTANADRVSFVSGGFSHSFNVLEGASAQVDLMAKIVAGAVTPQPVIAANDWDKSLDSPTEFISDVNYRLELIGFANPTAGGFTSEVKIPECSTMISSLTALVTMLALRASKPQRNRLVFEC